MDINDVKKMEFLKHEHALMLHGLHEEIKKLQKQCSDMQLQLISNGICPMKTDTLKEELKEMDIKYREEAKNCRYLQVELNEKIRIIEELEHQIESKDERYREDISARNLIIVRLRKEVQDKASTIANLFAFIQSKNKNTEKKSRLQSVSKFNCELQATSSSDCNVSINDDDEMSISRKICRRLTSSLGGSSSSESSHTQPCSSSTTIGRQIIEKYFRSSSLPPMPNSHAHQSPVKLRSQLNCSMNNISI
ncbi:hypothetical protein CHUAL_012922 [Chamberlinius hualienensis]